MTESIHQPTTLPSADTGQSTATVAPAKTHTAIAPLTAAKAKAKAQAQHQTLQMPTAAPALPTVPAAQQTLQLEDIHLPDDPTMWPPAYGWWIVLVLILFAGVLIPSRGYHYRKLHRQRKRILDALSNLQADLQQQGDNKALANINRLLRRLALMHYPREQVASLTGKQWLAFLDKSGETRDFTQGAGQLLADAPYRASLADSADISGLSKAVKRWVEKIIKEIHV